MGSAPLPHKHGPVPSRHGAPLLTTVTLKYPAALNILGRCFFIDVIQLDVNNLD